MPASHHLRIFSIVILLGLNFLVPVCVTPFEWYQALFSYVLVPALIGALAPWLLSRWRMSLQVFSVALIITFGAVLRPFLDGVRAGWDFTFDHEPGVEEIVALMEFVCAFVAFFLSARLGKGRPLVESEIRPSAARHP